MSLEGFDAGDLYGLEVRVCDLDDLLALQHEAKNDKAVRYGLIKAFELAYELAVKTMRKYLIATSERSEEAVNFDFKDLIRLADQDGFLLTGWPEWSVFRRNRGLTVHTYGDAVALQITAQLHQFAEEVHVLLRNLRRRVDTARD